MTKQHFSFQEIFSFGWGKTRQHAWFIFLTFLIISIVLSAVKLFPFINLIVSLMAGLSFASISLLISRDQHFTFHDLYTPLLSQRRVLKFIVLTVLYGIAVILGTILFIIPGLYVAVRFKFLPFVVIEHENASLKDLIKMSYKLTEGHFWPVFGLLILLAILNVVGFLFLVVGLFVTIPVSVFATAHVYNKLKEHSM